MRHDIQVLRGIAVLSVLFFHLGVFPLHGGFLGVDVFFVISGFLITGIILRGLEDESFSFSQFYLRRAKRLLPAAYSTLIFTTTLGYFFLTQSQWNDYLLQFFGSITFTSNFFIMFQTGYFEAAAANKPLLHMWSLSLEEQYYVFMPILLSIVALRYRIWLLLFLAVTSLACCLIFLSGSDFLSILGLSARGAQKLSFYMLPLRAWELLAGSLCAWTMIRRPDFGVPKLLKYLALAVVLYLSLSPVDHIHPRGGAIIAVLATSIMLLGNSIWLQSNKITAPIAAVGNFSYSLYLVHWPLLSLASVTYLGNVPKSISSILLVCSIILGYLQYNFVEQRFRHRWNLSSIKTASRLALATLAICIVPFLVVFSAGDDENFVDFSDLKVANHGLASECAQSGNSFIQLDDCITSDTPEFAIWGDSFAMHLIPGLVNQPQIGSSLVQITKSSCGPFIGLVQVSRAFDRNWAQECSEFNDSAFDFIAQQSSIKYVILSSTFSQFFADQNQKFLIDGKLVEFDGQIAIERMSETISELHRLGKIPVIVAPTPVADFDIGDCYDRMNQGLITFGRSDCKFVEGTDDSVWNAVKFALSELEADEGTKIFWPADVICDGGYCDTTIEDVYIYRDRGHLSVEGSKVVIEALGIVDFLTVEH